MRIPPSLLVLFLPSLLPTTVLASPWPWAQPATPTPSPFPQYIDTFPWAYEKRGQLQKRQTCPVRCNATACCSAGYECYTSSTPGDGWRCQLAGLTQLSQALDSLSQILYSPTPTIASATRAVTTTALGAIQTDFAAELSAILASYTSQFGAIPTADVDYYSKLLNSYTAAYPTATNFGSLPTSTTVRGKSDPLISDGDGDTGGGGEKKKTNVGAIAGGVVAGVAVIAIVGVLIAWLVFRKRKRERLEKEQAQGTTVPLSTGAGGAAAVETGQEGGYTNEAEKPVASPQQGNFWQPPPPPLSMSPQPQSVSPPVGMGYPPPAGMAGVGNGQTQYPLQQGKQYFPQGQPEQTQYPQPPQQYFTQPPPPPPVVHNAAELPPGQSGYGAQGGQVQNQYTGGSGSGNGGLSPQYSGTTAVTGPMSEVHGESVFNPVAEQPGPVGQTQYYEMDGQHGR